MQITFSLPHVFYQGSNPDEDAYARRILVGCLERLNRPYRALRSNPALYRIGTRCVVFSLPHVFNPEATHDQNAYALNCLMDCLVKLNKAFLEFHPNGAPLYKSGVFYERTEVWDSIPALYEKGYGDCKSLTAALVAEWQRQGISCSPVFRWIHRPDDSGAIDFHILVMTQNENGFGFEDPSKVLGMGRNENGPVRR